MSYDLRSVLPAPTGPLGVFQMTLHCNTQPLLRTIYAAIGESLTRREEYLELGKFVEAFEEAKHLEKLADSLSSAAASAEFPGPLTADQIKEL